MKPPCEKCLPAVMPGNREAFRVWEFCSSQVMTAGTGEVIDIGFPGVEIAIKRLPVRDTDELFLKVVAIARAFYGAAKKKNQNSGVR